jgi:pimeloyl-ACP methyl ester carboxylesterase
VNQELFPFDSHFVEVDGARVHYIDEGQGPVFLGLHGNPTWSFLYRHIVNGLKDQFRCVALDYPGFGLSTGPPGYRYTVADLPALIVWGDRDPAFKEPQRLRWERTFPNHKTVILEGASHYIQEDAPKEIVAAIKQWWPGE